MRKPVLSMTVSLETCMVVAVLIAAAINWPMLPDGNTPFYCGMVGLAIALIILVKSTRHFICFVALWCVFMNYVFPALLFPYLTGTWLFNNSTLNDVFTYELLFRSSGVAFMLCVGFVLFARLVLPRKDLQAPESHGDYQRLYRLLLGLGITLFIVGSRTEVRALTASVFILGRTASYFALFGMFVQAMAERRFREFAVGLALFGLLAFAFTTGLKDVFIVGAVAGSYYLFVTRRIPVVVMAVTPFMAGLAMSAKFLLRDAVMVGGHTIDESLGVLDMVTSTIGVISEFGSRLSWDDLSAAFDFFLVRTQYVSWLLVVVHSVPQLIPHQTWDFLARFGYSFLPGILFAKPVDDKGQVFGHMFSLLGADDVTTSANVPLIVDLYIIYGVTAIVLFPCVMFLMLRIYRWLARILACGGAGPVPMVFELLFVSVLFACFDSGTSLIGGYFYSLIVLLVGLLLLRGALRVRATPAS